jgi:ABC-type enterobactin transport system permease subunit
LSYVRVAVTLRAHDNRGERYRKPSVFLGTELITLAVRAASPVAVMAMSAPVVDRAVKPFALLGVECFIERFERRLRCL